MVKPYKYVILNWKSQIIDRKLFCWALKSILVVLPLIVLLFFLLWIVTYPDLKLTSKIHTLKTRNLCWGTRERGRDGRFKESVSTLVPLHELISDTINFSTLFFFHWFLSMLIFTSLVRVKKQKNFEFSFSWLKIILSILV